MNQQPFNPPAREPKLPIVPGIISTVGGILVIVSIFLPLITLSGGGETASLKMSDHFFAGGSRLWGTLVLVTPLLGILIPWTYIALAKATPEKRAQRLKSAGLGPVVGVVIGVISFILFILYLFVIEHKIEDGSRMSYPDMKEQAIAWGVDASWGIGLYLSILGFIITLAGLILFVLWYQKVKGELFLPYMNNKNNKQNQHFQGQHPQQAPFNNGQAQQNPQFGQPGGQYPQQGSQNFGQYPQQGSQNFGQPGPNQPGQGPQN